MTQGTEFARMSAARDKQEAAEAGSAFARRAALRPNQQERDRVKAMFANHAPRVV